jgi:hypothetical protein
LLPSKRHTQTKPGTSPKWTIFRDLFGPSPCSGPVASEIPDLPARKNTVEAV